MSSSPTLRLPHELLADIFCLVAQDPSVNPIFLSDITHVCARWRHIALSTQALWSRIVLAFPVTIEQISYSATCIFRSGAHPLDILLDLRDPSWDGNEDVHGITLEDVENVMRVFVPHFARWRKIELLADTWIPIFIFLWCTEGVQSGPMLEALSLSRCNAYFALPGQTFEPYSLREPFKLFGGIDLPVLRKVTLVGVHIDWSPTCVLRNLTHLDIRYLASDVTPTFEQFKSIIEECPRLEHLSIYGRGLDIGDAVTESSSFHLSSLKTLSFGFLDTTYAIRFFSLLHAPRLQKLVLEDISKGVNHTIPVDATPFLSWLSSEAIGDTTHNQIPFGQIQALELHDIRAQKDGFNLFFSILPSVTQLSLLAVSQEAISLLSPSDPINSVNSWQPQSQSFLFPALEELRCGDVDLEGLIQVVSSRAQIMPLQKVSLEFIREAPPEIGSEIRTRLSDAGIELTDESSDE